MLCYVMYYKSYRKKNIICIFNIRVGMKSAQMLASTDFHTITHAVNASVNLTLYDDKFGLQGHYY